MGKLASKIIFVLMVIAALFLNSGCQTLKSMDYKFGDISRIYCGTTNKEIRANIKATLSDKGLRIGVDYCSSAGLVDALLIKPIQERT